jgi:ankyrin repeat protein
VKYGNNHKDTKTQRTADSLVLSFCLSVFVVSLVAAPQSDVAGLRLIVVGTQGQADALLARLQAGENFEDLARTQSIDRSASAGGYLGRLSISQLRPEFQAALAGLKPGQFSSVVRIGKEFALVQLLTDEESGPTPSSRSLQQQWATALSRNSIDSVKELLASGSSANIVYDDGSTVLMGAAQAGQTEIVRLLLSVRAQTIDGTTALSIAAYAGHIDITRMLLAAGSNPNGTLRDGSTAMMKAAQAGHAGVVRTLLEGGANANARSKNGLSALMEAAFAGHLEVVQMLLATKADVNVALDNGSTALMAAAQGGRTEIAAELLAAGANAKATSTTGGTALIEAAYSGNLETVRLLLKAGSDIDAVTTTGLTALMGASLGGHTEVVRMLLGAGANPNLKDSKGWIALTHARASANPDTVRLLLAEAKDLSSQERSLILGGVYLNEYYSSNESRLLDLAAAEFQNVLNAQPQNPSVLEWMGAVEVLRWDEAPTIEQFRKATTFLEKSVELDANDPDRHYWMAAVSSIFSSRGKGGSGSEIASIVDQGIEHAEKAIELDPEFADAMDHLSVLYRRKGDKTAADTAHANAERIRVRRGNRPSRFNDQFSRPAVPPAPKL